MLTRLALGLVAVVAGRTCIGSCPPDAPTVAGSITANGLTPALVDPAVCHFTKTTNGVTLIPDREISLASVVGGTLSAVINTATAHGLSVGTKITFADVAGATSLNGATLAVAAVRTDTEFILQGLGADPGNGDANTGKVIVKSTCGIGVCERCGSHGS